MSGPIRNFEPTMSSMQMVDYINEERKAKEAEGGKRFIKLAHRSLMTKVPKVLGKGCANFFAHHVNPDNQQEYPCYNFPKREACLIAMSYSYELQAKVFDRMVELEDEFNASRITTTRDRILIHKAVPYIFERTGACFPRIYLAISAAAGATNFPGMTMGHLARVATPLLRIQNEADTQADWELLHISGKALRGGAQLELAFNTPALYNPSKETL
ncbi:hypothetical protein [Rugamonas rubra]|uniref:Uncharacterized protein n=1 Tax=Rugamonas rubra TaxID=758825 RepID=A0A1I4SIG7_9BURK|nr:hypothetical protein [Rugamonas rubra]SFM64141.1 hypothetical protein SAMN02982985_04792 [Rugamonas rubra]